MTVGPFYCLADRVGGHGAFIDANGVVDPLLERIEADRIKITHVLVTHHHADPVVAVEDYRERFAPSILAHELTAQALGARIVDKTVRDGDIVESGSLRFTAIDTPGHAAGHLAFLSGGECFTANALFKGSVGGTLPLIVWMSGFRLEADVFHVVAAGYFLGPGNQIWATGRGCRGDPAPLRLSGDTTQRFWRKPPLGPAFRNDP